MKIVTFNIRCDYGQDGPNNFCFRQPLILRRLAAEKPDVIGFQEVLPHVQRWLREALPGYTVVGCGRGADYQGEAMTLAVRNETAELLDWRTFWLSPHPDVPGSRYQDQSECPRTCADAILYLRAEGRALRVYNTHLDHLSTSARAKGLHRILERMQADRRRLALPAVLMGDFNAEPGAPELAALQKDGCALRDAAAAVPLTFHGYGLGCEPQQKIDYLFTSPELRVLACRAWTDEENGVYLSDHYPLCAELAL